MSEPSLDASLGSLELGVLFSTLLYGVMIVQCYTYYQAGFKDAWLVKALVRKKSHGNLTHLTKLFQIIFVM